MSIPNNTKDREHRAFVESPSRGTPNTAKEVFVGNQENNPIPMFNKNEIAWDEINVSFPSNNQELFIYSKNSLSVLSVLVTYSNSNKKQIINIVKTIL
jgi:hypothetical protein